MDTPILMKETRSGSHSWEAAQLGFEPKAPGLASSGHEGLPGMRLTLALGNKRFLGYMNDLFQAPKLCHFFFPSSLLEL